MRLLSLWNSSVLPDCIRGTCGFACAAVDALEWIDIELLFTFVDTIDGALLNAGLIHGVDTLTRDYIWHILSNLSLALGSLSKVVALVTVDTGSSIVCYSSSLSELTL